MKRIGYLAGGAFALALGGCATLSESECLRGDWYAIGASDGRNGYTTDRLAHHGKACAKHGVGVEAQAYAAGHVEGLRQFCVPPRAFTLGRDGGTYYHQCPPESEGDFLPAYELGRDVYAVEQELAQLEKDIQALRKEMNDDEASNTARDIAEQRLRYVKNDRDRRERERDGLLERARRRGYGNVW